MTIGERIKNRRIELNLTQQQLADKLGYKDRSAVCQVEKDKNNSITTDRVIAFADALSCTPAYLMGWKDEEFETVISLEDYAKKISASKARLTQYLDAFAKLSPESQEDVLQFIEYKISREGK